MSDHDTSVIASKKADDSIPAMAARPTTPPPQPQPQHSTASPPTQQPRTSSSLASRSSSNSGTTLCESDPTIKPTRRTLSISNTLQTCGIILAILVAIYTISYAIKTFNLAAWTAFKDQYEWCENEVRVFNATAAGCTELLKEPLRPPPYAVKLYKRFLSGDGKAHQYFGEVAGKYHSSSPGSEMSMSVARSVAVFICIALLAGLAGLGRSRFVSTLRNSLGKELFSSSQILASICFLGHLAVVFSVIVHILASLVLNLHPRWAEISYRTSFMGSIAAYGISVHSGRGVNAVRVRWAVCALNLGLAIVWFFSEPRTLALLPYSTYSAGAIICFTRIFFYPEAHTQPPKSDYYDGVVHPNELNSAVLAYLATFSRYWVGIARISARVLEAILWIHLIFSTAQQNKQSFYQVVIYTAFLGGRWARYHTVGSW